MSKHHPECPMYNHDTCKELYSQKVCAIVRKDKTCLKKLGKQRIEVYEQFLKDMEELGIKT